MNYFGIAPIKLHFGGGHFSHYKFLWLEMRQREGGWRLVMNDFVTYVVSSVVKVLTNFGWEGLLSDF